MLTDVNIWAGQTLYSAHKLVLALSSSYFKLILTGATDNRSANQRLKLPIRSCVSSLQIASDLPERHLKQRL